MKKVSRALDQLERLLIRIISVVGWVKLLIHVFLE